MVHGVAHALGCAFVAAGAHSHGPASLLVYVPIKQQGTPEDMKQHCTQESFCMSPALFPRRWELRAELHQAGARAHRHLLLARTAAGVRALGAGYHVHGVAAQRGWGARVVKEAPLAMLEG